MYAIIKDNDDSPPMLAEVEDVLHHVKKKKAHGPGNIILEEI